MRHFRHFASVVVFFAWIATSGMGIAADNEPGLSGEIVLGATFPLTGALDNYGQSAYFGANTAVRLVNEAGGINGKKLILEWRDNRSDPLQAVRNIEELVHSFKVPTILGPLMSEATMAVRHIAEQLGVVIITPMATTDAAIRDNPWMFRATITNSAEASALIQFQMDSYGAQTVGIIYDSRYSFSTEIAGVFAERFAEMGGKVVGMYNIINSAEEKDFVSPLKLLARSNPDFIFAPTYALEATELIHAARDLDFPIQFCGTRTWDTELVFDAAGSRLANTTFASMLYEQSFSYRPFQVFFTAMEQAGMDNPDAQAASAYDAILLLAEALKTGESPADVRKGLLAIKNMPLATGMTTILPTGESSKPVLIRIVERRGGRLVPVYAGRYDPE